MASPTTILRELSEGKVARGGLKSGQKKRLEKLPLNHLKRRSFQDLSSLRLIMKMLFSRFIYSMQKILNVLRQNMLLQNMHATKELVLEQNAALQPKNASLKSHRMNVFFQLPKKLLLQLFRELVRPCLLLQLQFLIQLVFATEWILRVLQLSATQCSAFQ